MKYDKSFFFNHRGDIDYTGCYFAVQNTLLDIYEATTGKKYKWDGAHRLNEETLHILLNDVWAVLIPAMRENREKYRREYQRTLSNERHETSI